MSDNDVSPHTLGRPQLAIADGGIETALEDRLNFRLQEFAAFVLLDSDEGRAALAEYYRPFIQLAAAEGLPLVLDTPTWRANPDWGRLLGYDITELARVNTAAARLVRKISERFASGLRLTANGCIGPRYDEDMPAGAGTPMKAEEAKTYHATQVRALDAGGVDRVSAVTMSHAAEATGIVLAARDIGMPVTVSFAVGADGRLASGATLAGAILEVEEATEAYPVGYLVNCAHPSEVARALRGRELCEAEARILSSRIIGLRLNSARHDEEGPGDNPAAFAQAVLELWPLVPAAQIFGGCCGTDTPHIAAIVEGLAAVSR